ncbi:APC family permease [Kitasatospora atroaurantiaca]|uniref:Amino acid/polyamine/organocation transporter (APC superfamily) n=1 Tax=Kitasatospora atroaurantiaca TaxID=285545 RepID=A0A561EW19_9ACTN|nr:APC family permease [Kitasatospora atroaurantiaca]TWE19814.1 amino acid/polyamine/organocation transporter (APC superfamily) [Kitasatospora atroaurantiaca]
MTDTLRPPLAATPDAATDSPSGAPKKLSRSIGVVGGTLLTLSCVTPASSLFVIVPDLFNALGTYTAMAIAIGSIICIAVAFCYSELGTLIPSAGGEYAMVGTLAGRFAGWLVFIQSLIVVMIVPSLIAIGTADYLAPIVNVDPKIAGAAVMIAATVAGLLDLRANAWITGIFLVLEVIACAMVSFLGFAHSERGLGSLLHGITADDSGATSAVGMGAIVMAMGTALFVTQGFSTAIYLSEELENPRKNVARTVLWTLALSVVVILVPVVAITVGAPDLTSLTAGDISALVSGWAGSAVGTFISLCIALAIINAGIVMVIQNSRVLFASGRDKAWPASVNKSFGTLNKFSAPWVSTLAVGIPGAVLCFVPQDTLIGITGVAVAALYLLVAVAALLSRRNQHKHAPAWRQPLWPVLPIVLILALVWVLFHLDPSALAWTGGITAVASLYWVFYLRPRQDTRWVITVPEDEQV